MEFLLRLIGGIIVLCLGISPFFSLLVIGRISQNGFIMFILFFGWIAFVGFVLTEIIPQIFPF